MPTDRTIRFYLSPVSQTSYVENVLIRTRKDIDVIIEDYALETYGTISTGVHDIIGCGSLYRQGYVFSGLLLRSFAEATVDDKA